MKYVCFLVGTFLFFDLQIESGKKNRLLPILCL